MVLSSILGLAAAASRQLALTKNTTATSSTTDAEQTANENVNKDVVGTVKVFIVVLIILGVIAGLAFCANDYYQREFRDKKDLTQIMGLCLAQISNEEDRNPNNIIEMGVGTDEKNIHQWVEDIWETYD